MNSTALSKPTTPVASPSKLDAHCICSLCDCGGHDCATFRDYLARFGFDDKSAQTSIDLEHHNCRHMSSSSTMSSSKENQNKADGLNSCLPSERYLVRQAAKVPRNFKFADKSQQSEQKSKSGQRQDDSAATAQDVQNESSRPASEDELLRVLVTRPQLANKPRDNILFEGDMDLRTTFETSYEALAKMRLDYWRKYQQTAAPSGQTPTGRSTVEKSMQQRHMTQRKSPMALDFDEAEQDQGAPTRSGPRRQRSVQQTNQMDSSSVSEKTHKTIDDDQRGEFSPEQAVRKGPHSSAPVMTQIAKDTEPTDETLSDTRQQRNGQTFKSDSREKDTHLLGSTQTSDQTATTAQTAAAHTENSNFIDPDLSSIIVYDSNLNRLERVGTRKRSKHRPSTSLRSGARGLFGDQDELEEEPRVARYGEHHLTKQSNAKDTNLEAKNVHSKEEPATLEARNLANSRRQINQLTCTDRNIPVNSRRRVDDNANLRDHIREQQQSQLRDADEAVARKDTPRNIETDGTGGADLDSQMNNNLENLRIAQQEEAAAVDEIRRAADGPQNGAPILQTTSEAENPYERAATRLSSSQNSRQAKLQRTNQHQNFTLADNDYPEPKFDPIEDGRRTISIRGSPQAGRVYKNLFAESPDFISTTSQSRQRAGLAPSAGSPQSAIVDDDKLTEDQRLPLTQDSPIDYGAECRVFKLDRDFQYIGSQSGHKFFVERMQELDMVAMS